MSIYSVNILSVCLSVMLQKALLLMDVFILVLFQDGSQSHDPLEMNTGTLYTPTKSSGNINNLNHIKDFKIMNVTIIWQTRFIMSTIMTKINILNIDMKKSKKSIKVEHDIRVQSPVWHLEHKSPPPYFWLFFCFCAYFRLG